MIAGNLSRVLRVRIRRRCSDSGLKILMLVNLVVGVRCRRSRFRWRVNLTCHSHLKDRFTGETAQQHYFPTVLDSDAVRESETKACPLLLPLTDERFKEAVANIFRNAITIINDA